MTTLVATVLILFGMGVIFFQHQSLKLAQRENNLLKEQLASNESDEVSRLRSELARLQEQGADVSEKNSTPMPVVHNSARPGPQPLLTEGVSPTTNKLERLAQIRETFRMLAAGDPLTAMRAAKQMTNEVEFEAALMTLVSEWTHGELSNPSSRAHNIGGLGLEAGLGLELAGNPHLAQLWMNEFLSRNSSGRFAMLREMAYAKVASDPAASFALMDQVSEKDRRKFFDLVLEEWASKDTEAALRWVDQFADPADRDAGLATIRNSAPVGIGTVLSMKDGYPVIVQVSPGTPADLSGQLRRGDRIVALAQGNNSFVDVNGMKLDDVVNMVRGDAGTMIQLQVLSADAPAGSPPRIVPIIRDQIKYKR